MSLEEKDRKYYERVLNKRLSFTVVKDLVVFFIWIFVCIMNMQLIEDYQLMTEDEIESNEWLSQKLSDAPEYCSPKCWLIEKRKAHSSILFILFIVSTLFCIGHFLSLRRAKRVASSLNDAGLLNDEDKKT